MKVWLVFYGDDCCREGCSVFYSSIVKAGSKAEAIEKIRGDEDADRFDAEEHEVIE